MSKTTSTEELARKIEELVQEHIAEVRRTAREAVERAFAAASISPASQPHQPREPKRRERATRRRLESRRTSLELGALGDKFYQVVCAHPGEPMATLSKLIGASARELNLPMRQLRNAGRIRSVGKRHHTRYFPVATMPTENAAE